MSRSKEENEYDSYSDDFDPEEGEERDEVEQEQAMHSIVEEESEDEIKVIKSTSGPSLIIQPRPRKPDLLAPVKTESDPLLTNSPRRRPLPKWKPAVSNPKFKTKTGSPSVNKVPVRAKKEESNVSISRLATPVSVPTKRPVVSNGRLTKTSTAKNKFTTSYNYVNIGKPGTRRVPGTTNVNNRGYTRTRHPGVSPYNAPPMKLGPARHSTVADRVASAKRMTINDLKNKIAHLQGIIEELKKENRTLNHMQNRQSLALKKWEGRDAELPRLLQQHKDELTSQQEQVKRVSITCRDLEERLRAKDKKLASFANELDRMKQIVAQEDLLEREDLTKNLDIVSANLSGAEKRIRQYMRHVEILQKNHQHQIAAEQQKLIRANNHALQLREEIGRLKQDIRERDRILNYIQMRSQGRNLIRSYQDKERVQYSRYQFPSLDSDRSRVSESHVERSRLRSRSLDERSYPSGPLLKDYDNEKDETSINGLSGRDSLIVNGKSLNGESSRQEASVQEERISRSKRSKSRYSMPSSHGSKHQHPDNQSYYQISQMLGTKKQKPSRSSLPPKGPGNQPLGKVRKQLRFVDSDLKDKETTKKYRSTPRAPTPYVHSTTKPSKSKTTDTIVEVRDEHNRKIKQYTTTHVTTTKHNDSSPRSKFGEGTSEPNDSNLNSSRDRQTEVEPLSLRPHSHSKASGTREKGLEVRVQIIKNPSDNSDTDNSASSRDNSPTGFVKSNGSDQDEPLYSHRSNLGEREDGQTSRRKSSFLESEPEEMIKLHEEAIGDFLSATLAEIQPATPLESGRDNIGNCSFIVPTNQPPADSLYGKERSRSQAYSSSMPMVSSPKLRGHEQSGFFNASPNYPQDEMNYSNHNPVMLSPRNQDWQDPGHLGLQVSPRGANSYPQMAQYNPQAQQMQQPRGVFTNNPMIVSPRRHINQNPMNLPFFSHAELPRNCHNQQNYRQSSNIPVYQGGHFRTQLTANKAEHPYFNPNQNQVPGSRPYNAVPSESYDPTAFTKLGTWK